MAQSQAKKVWFITGASRGFGLLIAKDALERGDFVAAAARKPETVTQALGEYANLLSVRLDVTNESEAGEAAALAVKKFGRIDVLINNAGYGLLGGVEESSAEEVNALFQINVFGLLNVTRAILPYMRRQRSGHVINISSIGGYASSPGWGVYCATKFAVEALTESLAIELAPLGIHATVVEPGYFRTNFLDDSSLVRTKSQIDDYDATVGEMRRFAARVSHKQPGDPKKLAKAMLVLVDSDKPPVRLPLGSDTVAKVREKNAFVENELQQWLKVAVSTDHDDVNAK
jgi:NAD(P)-dependent dehydrogenase (short-subunit alcohol dehydrogenase family)